jgi:dGTPase
MEWQRLFSRKRSGVDRPELTETGRSSFQKDIDRIIFSSAFRRLNYKTQVHPLPENDNVRTRLPHSLEVSCVGRSLGTKVGERLDDELKEIGIEPADVGNIVQVACLAHDIGNPPFGHSGEEAIRYWFQANRHRDFLQALEPWELADFMNFEGNAQGFRILTELEYYFFQGGMRLTYASLGAFMKYPWTIDGCKAGKKKKHGCNRAELAILTEVATELGLQQTHPAAWCRHPLSYLMEAADDICYALIDLEDGVEMNFLRHDEVIEILETIVDIDKIKSLHFDCSEDELQSRHLTIARGKAMNVLIDGIVATFIREKDALLAGNLAENDLIDACGGKVRNCIYLAKAMARDRIFNNPRKLGLEIGFHATIEVLLDSFIRAVYSFKTNNNSDDMPFKDRQLLQLMAGHQPRENYSLYECYMHALDYISSMTDKNATQIADRLRGIVA